MYYDDTIEMGAENLDQWARGIMLQAWQKVHGRSPTLAERQLSQAVGRLETYYGRAGQFKGSHNWGAVQHSKPKNGQCPPGTFKGVDHMTETGPAYDICEQAYSSDLDGAAHMLKIMSRTPLEKEALKSGSASRLAIAMKGAGYYGATVKTYTKAIYTNARDIAKNCGEPLAVTVDDSIDPSKPKKPSYSSGGAIVGIALIAGIMLLRRKARS